MNIRHHGEGRTLGERLADGVTGGVGSWPFIITQSILLGVWIVANAFLIRDWLGGKPFDPYPFILLNLVLSFQAAYTGPVVMMSQNRQAAKDRDEAEHDYEVNRDALERLRRLEVQQDRLHELLVGLTRAASRTEAGPTEANPTPRPRVYPSSSRPEASGAGPGEGEGNVAEQSLYERIGGVNALAMVVDRFSDRIVENPKLNVNPALKEWNEKGKLPGLKFMRTLWLCEVSGGPFRYTGKDMHEAHKDLHISSEEFDEVGAEIASALDNFKVPEREKQEVLAAIVARKAEVIDPSR